MDKKFTVTVQFRMGCPPGFDPLNCTISFISQAPGQWTGMRFLVLVILAVGLVFAAILWLEHLEVFDGEVKLPSVNIQQCGIMLVMVSQILLIVFYGLDPGFQDRSRSMAGLMSLMIGAAWISGCATALLVGMWVTLLNFSQSRIFSLSPPAFVLVVFIMLYFATVGIVFSVSNVYFSAPWTGKMFIGLLCLMTIIDALIVPACGLKVIQMLIKARVLRQDENPRVRRVRIYIVIYSVVQIGCAIAQFVPTFYGEDIGSTAALWIWMGVGWGGLIFGLAFFAILLAFKRVGVKKLSLRERTDHPTINSSPQEGATVSRGQEEEDTNAVAL